MVTGGCDCGQVRFEVAAVRDTVSVCHCTQCRCISGHLWASTTAPFSSLRLTQDGGLTWYASSSFAKRGFCKGCGASLFYRLNDDPDIAIGAGCLDAPTGMRVSKHIFCKDKGDYYDIADGAEQIDKY